MLGHEFAVKVGGYVYVVVPKLVAHHLQVGRFRENFVDCERMPKAVRMDAGEFLFEPLALRCLAYPFSLENMPPLENLDNTRADGQRPGCGCAPDAFRGQAAKLSNPHASKQQQRIVKLRFHPPKLF